DFDKDGHPDVAVVTSKGFEEIGTVYWFKSPGNTGASWERFQIDPGMETAAWVAYAFDLNGDGFDDLAVGRNDSRVSSNPGGIIFYINPGNPEAGASWQQYAFEEGDYKMGPYFQFDDIDGNGQLDIVSTYTGETKGEPGNVSWIVFHFDPTQGLVMDQRYMIAAEHLKAWDVHSFDPLGDGTKGLVVSDFNIGNIVWYEKL
ncbi:MAG: VCBS repeat-containing protein, partial [Planctomycetes bacterium]|nr:VCBS repeat-containing protein [Planctomycetota bacterium]